MREFRKSFKGRYFSFSVSHRSSRNPWGRFGGGWQWAFGVQCDERFRVILISALIVEIRIVRVRHERHADRLPV